MTNEHEYAEIDRLKAALGAVNECDDAADVLAQRDGAVRKPRLGVSDARYLPPLPVPYYTLAGLPHFCRDEALFSDEQMREYARAAIAKESEHD